MKVGIISYVPPSGRFNSDAFYRNISAYQITTPLYLISDDKRWQPSLLISEPDIIGHKPPWAVNNLVFLYALKLATDVGLDWFYYIESDSRVCGNGWAEMLVNDFFTRYPNGIATAGSPVCWNSCSVGAAIGMRVIDMAHEFQHAVGVPMAMYGARDPAVFGGLCLYANGSCAFYQTSEMLKIFEGFTANIGLAAMKMQPWDWAIGQGLWRLYQLQVVDKVGFLTKSLSCYGEVIVPYQDRKAMLQSGRIVAMHQAKDSWIPG